MKSEFGLFVCADVNKCTGCKACELACFKTHNTEVNNVGKTVGTVEVPVTPKLFVTVTDEASMPIQCKHCENAPCKAVCKQNAIKREDGTVYIDEKKCIGCKDCLMACPFGAVTLLPYFIDSKQVVMPDTDEGKLCAAKCNLCFTREGGPACIEACPNEALRIVDVNEERKDKNIAAAEALAIITGEGRTL